jgi:N-acetylglucosaminyldiphosphoundecaprenol N-acetyl-beta-D-mannosaminyltransferase
MQTELLDVCGVPVVSCPPEPVLQEMDLNIRTVREPRCIAVTNTESMYYAVRQEEHLEYIRKASFSVCDGMGVVIAGFLNGRRIVRLNGPVLMEKCCEYGIDRGWRHFFYGGKPGVPEMLRDKLTRRFPGLITAGLYSPPFRAAGCKEDSSIVERINEARPDILWVGLGLLKQERWIARHIGEIRAPWMVGVGAAFDYHAGTAKWAPPLIRAIGFEWLYRLAHEPRMFKRVARSFGFLFRAAVEASQRKLLAVERRLP